jgi:hypothetical protein
MAGQLHVMSRTFGRAQKVSQTTQGCSGITLSMVIFFSRAKRFFFFFTVNGANENFRIQSLKRCWFSVLTSNPFARRFSAGPRSSAHWPYVVPLLFVMHWFQADEETFWQYRIRPSLPASGGMEFCLLGLTFLICAVAA